MTGCTNSISPESDDALQPICISATQTTLTRADDSFVSTKFTKNKHIGVFGYVYTAATWKDYMQPNLFNNQEMTIERTAATSSLTYSPVKYWPTGNDTKIALYGYYPHNDDATNIVLNHNYGLGLFTYTTSSEAKKQTDFMVSPLLKDLTYSSGALHLEFLHTLASVEINIDLTGTDYKQIKSVTVTNVIRKGVFNPQVMNDCLNASPATDDWRTTAWTYDINDRTDMEVVAAGTLAEGANLDATTNDKYKLLLIPQQCDPALTKIQLVLVDDTDVEQTKELGVSDLWKAGKTYTYEFKKTTP